MTRTTKSAAEMITQSTLEEDMCSLIRNLADELKSFNSADLLVNISGHSLKPLALEGLSHSLPYDNELKKIHQTSNQHFRETGVNLLSLARGVLQWSHQGKEFQTPLLIYPIEAQFNKIKQELELQFDQEEGFLNPYLVYYFAQNFDFQWPEINLEKPNWTELTEHLTALGFEIHIQNQQWIGNFHHHRFAVLSDLDALLQKGVIGQNVSELLDNTASKHFENIPLSNRLLFPSDNDQLNVFNEIEYKNVVVQGPPGTGKSQVISNILGKTLFGGYSTLVVSEKRVALEVIQKKLKDKKLASLCFLPDKEKNARRLIQQLKDNWQMMEDYRPMKSMHLDLSTQLIDSLQFKMNILIKDDLVGGVSYDEYQKLVQKRNLSDVPYNGMTASIEEFVRFKPFLEIVFSSGLHNLTRILPQGFIEDHAFLSLDQNIAALKKRWLALSEIFPFSTKAELSNLMKKASFAQMMANEQHQPYFKLLNPTTSNYNKFGKLVRKLNHLNKEIETYSEQENNWRIQPSMEEAKGLLEKIKEDSLFQKYRIKRRMGQLLKSSFFSFTEVLEKWIQYCQLVQDKLAVEKSLLTIGISNEREIEWVSALQMKLFKDDWREWKGNSAVDNNLLASQNAELHILYQNIRTFFVLDEEDRLEEVFAIFQKHFSFLLENRGKLSKLSDLLYKQIGQSESLEALEKEILKSNWSKFIGQFTAFENFELASLQNEINEIIDLQDKEGIDFAEKIKNRIHQRFDTCQKLILKGTRKLSKIEREKKERLKKGRSILIKEFAKTRSHPTIHEMLNSEANEWIQILLPVWMLNPAQTAHFFPLKEGLFDFALFDEATQIPLSNALGSIERGKRILVVGDEHQMTPQFYFQSRDSEVVDLLHQASFSWKRIMLKHHYRSENPELISFSNRHFYEDKLIAYPSAGASNGAITRHYCAEGTFVDRKNIVEAKALASRLRDLLPGDESIGVVAFSESQLNCILQQLTSEDLTLVEQKIEKDLLFFKALENVQGEECDQLLISLGYGPNEDGKLLLNFGPLNRSSGRRRLNVLLTRARKNISFFTSVHSENLVISQNDSLNLLRLFLSQIEQSRPEQFQQFPHGLKATVGRSEIGFNVSFDNIFKTVVSANELVTLQRVLQERNWQVRYA